VKLKERCGNWRRCGRVADVQSPVGEGEEEEAVTGVEDLEVMIAPALAST
jgi:hypothetical protein